jgi:methionine synthase I (cobalamin-dependent)
MVPEFFVEGIQECIDAGATLVGGCCGTTPEHIRAVGKMLHKI